MRCFLFDIDGTLSDPTHRLHHIQKEPKDWNAFFDACKDDVPIPHMVELTHHLSAHARIPIVFVSGRSDRVRRETQIWLQDRYLSGPVYMRKDGDHRPDHLVKAELLDQIRADGYGIPCAQVADGDF